MKRIHEDSVQQARAVGITFKALCDAVDLPVTKDDVFRLMSGDPRSQQNEDDRADESDEEDADADADADADEDADADADVAVDVDIADESRLLPGCTIYALRLVGGYFYVGRSESDEGADLRIEDHKNTAGGCKWTAKHPFESVMFKKSGCSPFAEDMETLILMQQEGIDNVRGGTFCNIAMEQYQYRAAKDMIVSATGACYKCLKKGHCRRDCPEA
jgi:hypothetical protein